MNWPTELSPDEPRDEPARLINPALWSYWLSIGQSADLSEREIIQRLDHMSEITVEHAVRMAALKGCKAERCNDRLIVSLGDNNFSLFIVDDTVSALGFDRALAWLLEA